MHFPKQTLTGTLFSFSALSATTYVLTRALGVSLLLIRMGSDALPLALAASAITVIVISLLTRITIRYVPTRYGIAISWTALAAISFYLSSQIVTQQHSLIIVGALYVLAEVRGCLNSVYLTTLSNDAFAQSTSMRPYVLVAAGAPVAGIIAGIFLSIEVSEIDYTTWLRIIACLDVAVVLLIRFLPKVASQKSARKMRFDKKSTPRTAYIPAVGNGRRNYLYALGATVALKVIVLTLLGYQWKLVVADYIPQEDQMITYFAAFYAISDILIVLLQFTASGKLLDRFGIGVPLRLYPIVIAGMGLVAILADSLTALMIAFTVGRGFNVIQRSLYDPGLAVAYAVLDPRARRGSIVIVVGMIKPFAEAIAAIGLILYADIMTPNQLTWIWTLLVVPWFVFASWVASTYRQRTEESGENRILAPE